MKSLWEAGHNVREVCRAGVDGKAARPAGRPGKRHCDNCGCFSTERNQVGWFSFFFLGPLRVYVWSFVYRTYCVVATLNTPRCSRVMRRDQPDKESGPCTPYLYVHRYIDTIQYPCCCIVAFPSSSDAVSISASILCYPSVHFLLPRCD